jgi:hypothetical protein
VRRNQLTRARDLNVVWTRLSAKVNQNASAGEAACPRPEVFTYAVQFIDLDPVHHTMLQCLTYEAWIGDRQKIV